MNVLKEAAQDLRDYLGNDERGKNLLAKVIQIANDQRTKLKAMEESNAAYVAKNTMLSDSLTKNEGILSSVRQELEKEKSLKRSAEYREKAMSDEVDRLKQELKSERDAQAGHVEIRESDEKKVLAFKALLKEVKRHFRKAPCIDKIVRAKDRDYSLLYIEGLLSRRSNAAFTAIGMLSTVCAMMNMPIIIAAKVRFRADDKHRDTFRTPPEELENRIPLDEGTFESFVRWMSSWIMRCDDGSFKNPADKPHKGISDSSWKNMIGVEKSLTE